MIALGHELARRGHDVSVTAFAALRPLVEEAGLPFVRCRATRSAISAG